VTVKITKWGNLPPPAEFTGRCRRCKCEFFCDRGDFHHSSYFSHHEMEQVEYEYVKCPCCFHHIEIELLKEKVK
jgi:hypothetical protein